MAPKYLLWVGAFVFAVSGGLLVLMIDPRPASTLFAELFAVISYGVGGWFFYEFVKRLTDASPH